MIKIDFVMYNPLDTLLIAAQVMCWLALILIVGNKVMSYSHIFKKTKTGKA